MSKIHVNLKTGETGQCEAEKGGCPFGGDDQHYTSETAAREAYDNFVANDNDPATNDFTELKKPKRTTRTRTVQTNAVDAENAVAGRWDSKVVPNDVGYLKEGEIFFSKTEGSAFEVTSDNPDSKVQTLAEIDSNGKFTGKKIEVNNTYLKTLKMTQLVDGEGAKTDGELYNKFLKEYKKDMEEDYGYHWKKIRYQAYSHNRALEKAQLARFDEIAKKAGKPTYKEIWLKHDKDHAKQALRQYELWEDEQVKNGVSRNEREPWVEASQWADLAEMHAKRTGDVELIARAGKLYDDAVVKAWPRSERGQAVIAQRLADGVPTGELKSPNFFQRLFKRR